MTRTKTKKIQRLKIKQINKIKIKNYKYIRKTYLSQYWLIIISLYVE